MIPLGDEALVESCFGPFRDSVNLDAYDRLEHRFGRTRWNSLLMWVIWNLASFHLETVLASVQDSCTVCAKCTIRLEIVLDAPDGIPS